MGARKPGLLLPLTKVEVEDVKKSHRKECGRCHEVPKGRRLKITRGAGRHAITKILCVLCGKMWLWDREREFQKARLRLQGDSMACRLSEAEMDAFIKF